MIVNSNNNQTSFFKPRIIYLLIVGFSFFSTSCSKDDEPGPKPVVPLLTFSDVSVTEGTGSNKVVAVGFYLSEATTVDVTVKWSTQDGSAKAGEDYVAVNEGSVTFTPGQTLKTFLLEIISDDVLEFKDKFYFNIDTIINAVSILKKGLVIITNDDSYAIESDANGYITPNTYPGMTLAWSDEFDGSSINSSNWTHEQGGGGWGNNELQFYTSSANNSFVSNGFLTIRAIKESSGGYTSARMITRGKKEFKYGRIDIRAKMPKGKGIWPALWMLGANISTFGWPGCGEIDIMEYLGHETTKTYGTVHYSDGGHKSKGSSWTVIASENYNQKFHVFSIIWQENSMEFYVDYHRYFAVDDTSIKFDAFNLNQFFIFNVAVGGNWPGYPDATTTFPQEMIVDYVRVFN